MTAGISVVTARIAVVTDLGRERGPAVGLPVGGALDQYSARVANILVANDESAPIIEVTAFDFAFVTDADLLLAVTGAPMTVVVDGVERSMWEPLSVSAGQRVELVDMAAGLRTYVALHGSVETPLLLGSCAPDTVAGFGATLHTGSRLEVRAPVGAVVNPYFDMSLFNLGVLIPYFADEAVIDIVDGPDAAQFAGTADKLFRGSYAVTAKSNHIGLRLTGDLPVRASSEELISRGVPVGAVEVPPGDELLILHRGRGVTAGYPVLAVVTPLSLDDLGQVRPGQHVRFRRTTIELAEENARAWRAQLDTMRRRVRTVYECLGLGRLLGTDRSGPPCRTEHPPYAEVDDVPDLSHDRS